MMTETDRQMLMIAYQEARLGFDEGGCPTGSVLARAVFYHALVWNSY